MNEIIKTVATILSPFVASWLTYQFAIKGKLKDKDIQTKYELNNVLSNLLIVRHYIIKIQEYFQIKYDSKYYLPIPKNYLVLVMMKSEILNHNSFDNLEESIANLKRYDPIQFYEMEGLGNRLKFIKNTFIIPFLNAKANYEINRSLASKFMDNTLEEVNSYILSISVKLNDESTLSWLRTRETTYNSGNYDKVKEDVSRELYELVIATDQDIKMSFEEFQASLEKEEIQSQLDKIYEGLEDLSFEDLMKIVANDPFISLSSLAAEQMIKKASP